MPVSHVVFFGLLVLGALALVFPGQKLGSRLLASSTTNALSLAYLNVWLRADPADVNARLLLAHQQTITGQPDKASLTLRPLVAVTLPDSGNYFQLLLLQLGILKQRYWQAPVESLERRQIRHQITQQLARFQAANLSAVQAAQLAKTAAQFGDAKLALAFLAPYWQQQHKSTRLGTEVAALLLGQRHYRAAADIHLHAMQLATNTAQQRLHFIAALRALQAGNQLDAAMRFAKRYWQPLQQDPPTLRFLIRLARAANQPQQASLFAAYLLRQRMGAGP